jgi:hypothetical protein
MSSEKEIVCRRCREVFPADVDSCPQCGTSVRGNTGAIAGLVVGGLLVVFALADFALNSATRLIPFGILGLLIAGSGYYVIYDKRQRIEQAAEASEDAKKV